MSSAPPMEHFLDQPILVIDDTELNLQLVLNILTKRGFTHVICARDGVEALESIVLTQPKLIILDVMMPRMDGAVLCKYLKAMPDYRHIPVLVLASTPEEYMKLAVAGAIDLITKPIIPRMLISKVIEHLNPALVTQGETPLQSAFESN